MLHLKTANPLAKMVLTAITLMVWYGMWPHAIAAAESTANSAGVIMNNDNGTLSCLGIVGQAAAGAKVTTVNCDSNAPVWQQLQDGRIQYGTGSEGQSFCLDADSAHPSNWNKAQIWNCSGTLQNQNWSWSGNGVIQFKLNSLCLAPETQGQQLLLSKCIPQDQTWALATTPSAPKITAVVVDFTEATVGFTPPANNGGIPITQYVVTVKGPTTTSATGSTSPIYASGLTNDTPTVFTVAAVNLLGKGPDSPPFNSSMQAYCNGDPANPGCPPHDAPQITSVTPGNQQVTVAFNPVNPLYSGGSPIVSYSVCASPYPPGGWQPTYCGRPGEVSASGPASPIVVSGLTNGTPYIVTVTATNADQWGKDSQPSQRVTPTASTTLK